MPEHGRARAVQHARAMVPAWHARCHSDLGAALRRGVLRPRGFVRGINLRGGLHADTGSVVCGGVDERARRGVP